MVDKTTKPQPVSTISEPSTVLPLWFLCVLIKWTYDHIWISSFRCSQLCGFHSGWLCKSFLNYTLAPCQAGEESASHPLQAVNTCAPRHFWKAQRMETIPAPRSTWFLKKVCGLHDMIRKLQFCKSILEIQQLSTTIKFGVRFGFMVFILELT